ncbi:MAG TPA: Ig-like domain-containing protein [Micromonospora sp.]
MSIRRFFLLAVAALLVVGAVPPPALAGGRNEPIYGDVNGDGLTDRIYLGVVQPDRCSVIVEYGVEQGGFGRPVAYAYLKPGGTGLATACPDLGVAVELGADGVDELVVAWFAGPPASISYTLLVLGHDFQPDFGLTEAIFQPTFMGTADFNGDGRPDVHSVTDQGQGFETYLSLGDLTLTPGPEKWCAGPLQYQLKDFDHNGAMDVLITYIEGCSDYSNGAVVVMDDGSVAQLQWDESGLDHWRAQVVYADDDRVPDVRTESLVTGAVNHFIGVGDGTFVLAPRTVGDTVTVPGDRKTNIPVLANDYVTTQAVLTIVTPPRYGRVQVTSSRTVVFTPAANHGLTDRFVYQVAEDGRTSRTSVTIRFAD